MLLEFKTARSQTGGRKYLAIATDKKVFTRNCPKVVTPGIEIKSRDYKELTDRLKKEGYTESSECL